MLYKAVCSYLSPTCTSKPLNQFNISFNISSVRTMGRVMRGGAQKGGSYEGDEAELNLDIKQRERCEGGGTWA